MKMSKSQDVSQNLFDDPIFQPQKKYHKIAKKLEKGIPKEAKKHAKKIETAIKEEDYFVNSNKQTIEREDLISGLQMDKMLNSL